MEDKALHIVGQICQRHLGGGRLDANCATGQIHWAFLMAEDMFNTCPDDRTCRVASLDMSGIGLPLSFLRWMCEKKPLALSQASLLLVR